MACFVSTKTRITPGWNRLDSVVENNDGDEHDDDLAVFVYQSDPQFELVVFRLQIKSIPSDLPATVIKLLQGYSVSLS